MTAILLCRTTCFDRLLEFDCLWLFVAAGSALLMCWTGWHDDETVASNIVSASKFVYLHRLLENFAAFICIFRGDTVTILQLAARVCLFVRGCLLWMLSALLAFLLCWRNNEHALSNILFILFAVGDGCER